MTDAATDQSTHDARAQVQGAPGRADAVPSPGAASAVASAVASDTAPGLATAPALRDLMHRDLASALLGIVVESAEPGRAVVSMHVRDDLTNGFGITHGGFVFTLADTAFALACNEDERVTVAAGADISFLKSTVAGQTLRATAVRRTLVGRTGLYDVAIVDETGDAVAEFRGRSLTTNRSL